MEVFTSIISMLFILLVCKSTRFEFGRGRAMRDNFTTQSVRYRSFFFRYMNLITTEAGMMRAGTPRAKSRE
jgi:hypothetical protein